MVDVLGCPESIAEGDKEEQWRLEEPGGFAVALSSSSVPRLASVVGVVNRSSGLPRETGGGVSRLPPSVWGSWRSS